MKYLIVILLINLFGSTKLFSQEKELISYSEYINFDTIVVPDYYKIYVSIAEYKATTYSKKEGRKTEKILCDSLRKCLSLNLIKLNVSENMELVKASDKLLQEARTSYLDDPNSVLRQETYLIKIDSLSKVKLLYLGLNVKGLNGVQIIPFYSNETLSFIKEKMKGKALNLAETNVLKYCKQNSFILKELESIVESHNSFYNTNDKSFNERELYNVEFELLPITYRTQINYNLIRK